MKPEVALRNIHGKSLNLLYLSFEPETGKKLYSKNSFCEMNLAQYSIISIGHEFLGELKFENFLMRIFTKDVKFTE